jgi:O-antigen ligase
MQKKSKKPFWIVLLYTVAALLFVNDGVTIRYHIIDGFFILYFIFDFFFTGKRLGLRENIYVKTISLFSIYLLFSYYWSPSSTFQKNLLLQGSLILNSMALFYIISKYRVWEAVLVGYVIYGYINHLLLFKILPVSLFSSEDSFIYGRFVGAGLNANTFAIDLFFGTFSTLLLVKITRNRFYKFLLWINIPLVLNAIIYSGSKKGLSSFIIIMVFYLYQYYLKYKSKTIIYASLGLVAICIAFLIYGDSVSVSNMPPIFDRFAGLFREVNSGVGDDSTSARISYILLGIEGFLKNPVLGYGQDAFAYFYYAYSHNNFIEILFNLGLVGFILYYRMFIILFIKNKSTTYQHGMINLMLFIILLMDTAMVSYNVRSQMIIFTLLSSFVSYRKDDEKGLQTKLKRKSFYP